MYAELNDVKGAFPTGTFSKGEKLYMKVPKGFEKFYPGDVVLLLLKIIYGLKQAAFEYWRALLKALKALQLIRSKADPCVYYQWTDRDILLWSSWVDNLLLCGNKKDVLKGREALKQHFDLDKIGKLKEYVGCKVKYNREQGTMQLTQPVLVQSFVDEFKLPTKAFTTPMAPGQVLVGKGALVGVNKKTHQSYCKGVGKLIHLGKYSRPEILNAVRELSRFGSNQVRHISRQCYVVLNTVLTPKIKDSIFIRNDNRMEETEISDFESVERVIPHL